METIMIENKNNCIIASSPDIKGGLGKTFIHAQCALAVAMFNKGMEVIIFDADPQQSMIELMADREKNKLPKLQNLKIIKKESDSTFAQDIVDASYTSDFIFIDTAGADNIDLTKVQYLSDIAYHLCDVSNVSTYKSKEFEVGILADIKLRKETGITKSCIYKTFYNGISPIPNVAKKQLSKCRKPVDDLVATGLTQQCDFNICRREPFTECMNTGASIFELDKENKIMSYHNAKLEIKALYLDFMNTRHNIIKNRG